MPVDPALFENPYEMSGFEWRRDSRAFTFEYNQRGHQVYRIIEVDANTGVARAVVDERPCFDASFVYHSKHYRHDAGDGNREVRSG